MWGSTRGSRPNKFHIPTNSLNEFVMNITFVSPLPKKHCAFWEPCLIDKFGRNSPVDCFVASRCPLTLTNPISSENTKPNL